MSLSLSGKNVAVVSAIAIMAVIGLCVLSLNSSDTPDDPNRPDDNFKTDDLGYRVTVLGDNILSWTPSKTSRGQEDLTVIITPAAGYRISCIAAVTMNGITLKDNDYRHAGGNVTMLVGIDGHVNVYADAHPDVYDVTVTGENVASWTSTETYRNQTDLAVTVRPVTGYHVSGIISVTMNGKAVKDTDYRCTENTVTFLIKIEGEIAICADLRPNAYDVTAIGENLASWTPGETYYGQSDLKVAITPGTGYHVPGIKSVTMNDRTLDESVDYTYTDNAVTFLVKVDGDVEIETDIRPDVYSVTVTGNKVAAWTPVETYHGQNALKVTIVTEVGYRLSDITLVTMNDKTLKEVDYTCTNNVVTFLISTDGAVKIHAYLEPDVYDVTVLGDKVSSWTPTETFYGQNSLKVIITADTGYHVSDITSVAMEGKTLNLGSDYRYSDKTVTFLINIDGAVKIFADLKPDAYSVSVLGDNVASWTPITTVFEQNDLLVTITADTGYHVSGIASVIMNGKILKNSEYKCVGDVVTFLTKIDGDVKIYANLEPDVYDVIVVDDKVTSWTPNETFYGQNNLKVTITPATGYHTSRIVFVLMDDFRLKEGTDYTHDDNTVEFLITIKGVVEIYAYLEANVYDVTITSNFFDAATLSSPGGPVKYGNPFTCSLVKKTPGFRFEGWYAQNGTLLSSSETYSFAVKDHVLIEARFSIVHDASFTVTLSNGKAPTNVTLTSAYNVEVAYRLWVIDDKLTGSRLRDLTGTKGQLNQTVYSAPHGQALSIIHSVTYSDGYTAFSRCTEVVDENVVKHFEWNYNRSADTSKLVTGTAAMAVPMNFAWYYDAVASKVPRSNGFNQLGPYVECNDPVIQWVAQELWRQARASDMTTLQTINFILKFIQSFPYITDTENKGVSNYWNLPPETLWEKKGDCEDHAFLLAAILKCLGIRCVVHSIHCFDGPVYTGAHVAVGVEVWNGSGSYVIVDGVKYFHCEATANVSTNWHWAYVGYLPQGDVIMATYKV